MPNFLRAAWADLPTRASWVLLLCTLFWASTFSVTGPLMKGEPAFFDRFDPSIGPDDSQRDKLGPFVLLTVRQIIGAIVILVLSVAVRRDKPLWHGGKWWGERPSGLTRTALVLGTLTFIGFGLQTVGLRYTTASRSALLTGLMVVFTPILGAILIRRMVSSRLFFAVALCMAGTVLLTVLSTTGPEKAAVQGAFKFQGELLTIGCAMIFAWQILEIERNVIRHDVQVVTITMLLASAVCSTLGALYQGESWDLSTRQILGATYLGVTGTGLCFLGGNWAQRHVNTNRTALILGAEPLFGALFAVWWLKDTFTPTMMLGGAMILYAIWLSKPEPGELSPIEEFARRNS